MGQKKGGDRKRRVWGAWCCCGWRGRAHTMTKEKLKLAKKEKLLGKQGFYKQLHLKKEKNDIYLKLLTLAKLFGQNAD